LSFSKIIIMGKILGAVVINEDRCKGCALCVDACPKNVLALAERKVNVHGYPYVEAVNADDCIGCASCGIVCPDGCITVYRKKMD
jgi:2-oxoglutarate ferredoxin oxidoreductase subunit delta